MDRAYEAYQSEATQLVILVYIDDATLKLAQRIEDSDAGDAVILTVFDSEPDISLDCILASPIDDLILPPLDAFRLEGRLKMAVRRAWLRSESHTISQALHATDAKARAILDTTVDGVITVDDQGVIRSFNPAAEQIFGYRANEVLGEKINSLMPPPYRDEHDSYIDHYHHTGQKKIIGVGREVKGMRKNGEIFPMELAVSEINLHGRRSYTGIVRDITERRELEQELLRISEEERRRIGQDLHDGLGQMLTGIGLIAQTLARSLKSKNVPEANELSELVDLIRDADRQARTLARTLVPLDLESGGLKSALIRLGTHIERLYNIKCSVTEAGETPVLDSQTASHFFHIIQEAMSNAARHSQATHLRVSLAGNPEQLRVRVEDNGIGLANAHNGHGMGLRIMRHRAAVIGANLDFRNGSDNGAIITCTLPLANLALESVKQ